MSDQTQGRGSDLERARAMAATIKAKEAQIRLRKLQDELIDREPALAHIRELAAAEGEALLQFALERAEDIAADLDVGADQVAEVLQRHLRQHIEIRAGVRLEIPA